jgi:hypothetical protein
VLIDWRIEPAHEGDRLILHWQEKAGPPVTPPSEKGSGSRVIERGLAHELQAMVNLDFRVDGVVCTIDLPAPRGAGIVKKLEQRGFSRAQAEGITEALKELDTASLVTKLDLEKALHPNLPARFIALTKDHLGMAAQ